MGRGDSLRLLSRPPNARPLGVVAKEEAKLTGAPPVGTGASSSVHFESRRRSAARDKYWGGGAEQAVDGGDGPRRTRVLVRRPRSGRQYGRARQ